ncbi:hypothetical protein TNCV_3599531 [Trichonephila clavipes]|nr:hypothetical protein TNCV_3599531 [Trichonephila clavipes]
MKFYTHSIGYRSGDHAGQVERSWLRTRGLRCRVSDSKPSVESKTRQIVTEIEIVTEDQPNRGPIPVKSVKAQSPPGSGVWNVGKGVILVKLGSAIVLVA